MNVTEYFDSVQEYVKQNIDDATQIGTIVKDLNRDNIQAVINQDYNNGLSIEESGEKMLKQMDFKIKEEDQPIPNEIGGERGMNTMERKVVNFNDFLIKESKKDGKTIMVMTGSPKLDMTMVEPSKDRTKTKFAVALSEHGYVQGRMNKDCDVLITNEKNSDTNKMNYARKNNIKIVTYAELIKKYNLFKK